jgi:nicotinamidase-related amidase
MQIRFYNDINETVDASNLVASQLIVIERCIREKIPFIEVTNRGGLSFTMEPLKERLWRLEKFLSIEKSSPDAFSEKKFLEQLRIWEIRKIFYMGIFADLCVRSTAITGKIFHGYEVVTNSEVIAPSSEFAGDNMEWLEFYEKEGSLKNFNDL